MFTTKSLFSILIILVFTTTIKAQTEREKEEQIRARVDIEVAEHLDHFKFKVEAITDFNGKNEFWSICRRKNGNRIIQIESFSDSLYYQEIYFEKNNQLFYAYEGEDYIPNNHFLQMTWNCQFYCEDGKLLSLISLGHGKTEDETWDPDVIFEMYEDRLSQLARIKK